MIRGKLKAIVVITLITIFLLAPAPYSLKISKGSSIVSIDICNAKDVLNDSAINLPAVNEWWCIFCKPCLSGSKIIESALLMDFILSSKEEEPPRACV